MMSINPNWKRVWIGWSSRVWTGLGWTWTRQASTCWLTSPDWGRLWQKMWLLISRRTGHSVVAANWKKWNVWERRHSNSVPGSFVSRGPKIPWIIHPCIRNHTPWQNGWQKTWASRWNRWLVTRRLVIRLNYPVTWMTGLGYPRWKTSWMNSRNRGVTPVPWLKYSVSLTTFTRSTIWRSGWLFRVSWLIWRTSEPSWILAWNRTD